MRHQSSFFAIRIQIWGINLTFSRPLSKYEASVSHFRNVHPNMRQQSSFFAIRIQIWECVCLRPNMDAHQSLTFSQHASKYGNVSVIENINFFESSLPTFHGSKRTQTCYFSNETTTLAVFTTQMLHFYWILVIASCYNSILRHISDWDNVEMYAKWYIEKPLASLKAIVLQDITFIYESVVLYGLCPLTKTFQHIALFVWMLGVGWWKGSNIA